MIVSNELKTFLADNKVQSLINDSEWTQLFLMLYGNYSELCTSCPDIDFELIECIENIGAATQEELIIAAMKAKFQYFNNGFISLSDKAYLKGNDLYIDVN